MDTATLMIADAVLRLKSLRAAGRELQKPPGSIAAAMARLEAALAVPLTRKTGSGLMLTLEGTRLTDRIAKLSELAATLFLLPPTNLRNGLCDAPLIRQDLPARSVSLEALFRLLIVAQTGSIRAAARRLKLGQPQLTRQIAHIEQVLGQTLLTRSREGCLASDAGKGVIDTIRRIESLWLEIVTASDERFRRAEITVRVGSVMPLGPDARLPTYWRRWPHAGGWPIRANRCSSPRRSRRNCWTVCAAVSWMRCCWILPPCPTISTAD